jgi:hypothetical protein
MRLSAGRQADAGRIRKLPRPAVISPLLTDKKMSTSRPLIDFDLQRREFFSRNVTKLTLPPTSIANDR